MEKNYDQKRQMELYRKLIHGYRDLLNKYFDEDTIVGIIIEKSIQNYKRIIPEIQWLGGRKNPLTNNLIGSAQVLALIMTLDSEGLSFNEIGEIVHDVYETKLRKVSPVFVYILRKYMRSKMRLNSMLKASIQSQKREYKDDWVFEYKKSNDQEKLFENTYYECAICKLYTRLGYEKYLPIICLLDYATFDFLGMKLERTMTLGNGCEKCDFKVFKNGNNVPGWPPNNHIEYRKM
jgi:hypothetical protein